MDQRRSTQKDKTFLNLAGEFAVASELNRRHVLASVTYGASKAADIFALDDDMRRVVRIEVKTTTTDRKKWVVGPNVAAQPQTDVFWVFVQLPPPGQSPKFFVFSAHEIHGIWRKDTNEYERRYEDKHGRKFEGRGVPNVKHDARVLACEGKWEKIISRLQKAPIE